MVRPVLKSGNPVLRKKSKDVAKVDKKIKDLVKDLKDTLFNHKDPEGVGLAAPQIGKSLRVFVMTRNNKMLAIVNPKVIKVEKTKERNKKRTLLEGCLSVPYFYGPLTRADKITLEYLTEDGEKLTEKFTGFSAQIILHEIDHLDGVLFIDHMLANNVPLYKQNKEGEWEEVEI